MAAAYVGDIPTVRLRYTRHITLLRVTHLLRMLRMLSSSLTVALGWENWRCLLVRVHLLLLCIQPQLHSQVPCLPSVASEVGCRLPVTA